MCLSSVPVRPVCLRPTSWRPVGSRLKIIDRMPSPARKFLMAGRGGLNITHSEDIAAFMGRYREAAPFLAPIIEAFPPQALIDWCHDLGQETFVGSSGRVFPVAMKASPLLRALLRRLQDRGATLRTRQSLAGLSEKNTAIVRSEGGEPREIAARAVLLAMGGASWPKLGSTASWVPLLQERGVLINPFQPAQLRLRDCLEPVAEKEVLRLTIEAHRPEPSWPPGPRRSHSFRKGAGRWGSLCTFS